MINNCINTFFTSVFRVLGRVFAYLLIGILIYLFSSKIGLIDAQAKPVTDVSGSYGLIKCNYDDVNSLSSCNYVQSYSIIGDNTTYTMLDKASMFSVAGTTHLRYNVFSSLYLFPSLNYKNGSFYTLNFEFDQGSYVSTIINTLSKDNLFVEAFNGSDYVSGGYTDLNYSASYNDSTKSGTISITFKATTDTSSYRIRIQPGVSLWTNTSIQYAQGVRVYLISANVEDNLSDALLNQITNQNETIINQNQQIIDNSNKTNDKLDNLDGTIKNEDISDIDLGFSDISEPSDTPISDLILMPITVLNQLKTVTDWNCQPWLLPFDFFGGSNTLQFSCINLRKYIGDEVFNIIDELASFFMIYSIALSFINFFEDITSLRDVYDDMYTPQHSAKPYIPKHGS